MNREKVKTVPLGCFALVVVLTGVASASTGRQSTVSKYGVS
jgi:hypothetical protein